MYTLREVNGPAFAEVLHMFNRTVPSFPELEERHLKDGFWWIAVREAGVIVGFAGMVPMVPFPGVGYLKRAYVSPDHRGEGLQRKFLLAREEKAWSLGWHMLVSESASPHAQKNFLATGYEQIDPEQKWGAPGSSYYAKRIP